MSSKSSNSSGHGIVQMLTSLTLATKAETPAAAAQQQFIQSAYATQHWAHAIAHELNIVTEPCLKLTLLCAHCASLCCSESRSAVNSLERVAPSTTVGNNSKSSLDSLRSDDAAAQQERAASSSSTAATAAGSSAAGAAAAAAAAPSEYQPPTDIDIELGYPAVQIIDYWRRKEREPGRIARYDPSASYIP
eukprot:18779-Heterococcus_DN1.PRE.1